MPQDDLQRLLAELATDEPDRETLADQLAAHAAAAVVPALLGIPAPKPPARWVVARVLGDLAPASAAGIPVLVRLLRDPTEDEDTRSVAADALGAFGGNGVAAFLSLCADPDAFTRYKAILGLKYLGVTTADVVTAFLAALSDPDRLVRDSAATALARAEDNRVVAGLTQALTQANALACAGAARALLTRNPQDRPALDAAIRCLTSDSAATRAAACAALEVAKEAAEPAIPALCRALADPDAEVRSRAAHALMELRDAARAAVPALGQALHDPCRDVRDWAGLALMRLDEAARPAAADLVEALRARVQRHFDPEDEAYFLLVYLMRAVGNIGGVAAAIPALEAARAIVADLPDHHELACWAIERCRGAV